MFTYSIKYVTNQNMRTPHTATMEGTDSKNAAGNLKRWLLKQPGIKWVKIRSIERKL